jgi:hypothetical protein
MHGLFDEDKRRANMKEYKVPNLDAAPKTLRESYNKYIQRYKAVECTNSSRNVRDQKFEKLLETFESSESLQDFNEICKFFLNQKDSGGFRRTPELIQYIRLSLYPIFGLRSSQFIPSSYCTVFAPSMRLTGSTEIITTTNETDYLKKALYKKLEEFCRDFNRDKPLELGRIEL